MAEPLSIHEESTHGAARVFRLFGRLDARGAATLASRCHQVCDPGRPLVLVLSGVAILSSSGVGTLLAVTEEYREARAVLLLAAPSEAVSSTVGLLNLSEFLAFHETEQDALLRAAA